MTLSRKHYTAVADILRLERGTATAQQEAHPAEQRSFYEGAIRATERLTDSLCIYFHSDNPNFDPARFRRACQP